jgi:hypothetical protein
MEEAKDPNMSSVCVSDDPNMHIEDIKSGEISFDIWIGRRRS